MSVLLTGGAGFIGSHTAVEMIHAGLLHGMAQCNQFLAHFISLFPIIFC